MQYYRECPYCGAHLDPCELCDCRQETQEDASDAAEPSSQEIAFGCGVSLSNPRSDVNHCLQLREIRQQAGVMAKDAALVVREIFPKFNRQLLAQCEAWDKYGVVIHPDGLAAICKAYGVSPPVSEEPPPAEMPENEAPATGLTQCDRILRHFKDFGSITSPEAMKEYGIMRLASRISDLKRLGYTIEVTTENGKNRYGEKTSYARYSLKGVPNEPE
jgi:hypothetical protein